MNKAFTVSDSVVKNLMTHTNKRLEFYDTGCFNRAKMLRGQSGESQGEGTDRRIRDSHNVVPKYVLTFIYFRHALCFIFVYNCGLTVRSKRICYVKPMLCHTVCGCSPLH